MGDHRDKILEVRELTKSFYGVAANDRVSFDLGSGEVHGLLGENGAGKSTLCSILAGLYRPDSGEIVLDGQTIQLRSPHDAAASGIGMVYQHFRLVPSFTVAENMILGLEDQGVRLSLRSVEARVAEISDEYGLEVDPGAYIWQLSVGEQQRVEILKQLYRGARILILDEPTAVLAPQECDQLYLLVRQMADQDHSVVLVSHKMDEILANTDRVTVLRHGRNAGTVATGDTDANSLASMMIGAEHMPEAGDFNPRHFDDSAAVLTLTDLTVMGDRGVPAVNGATLEVRSGQIVGVAGVAGNGQRELQEAIAGLRPATGGSIHIGSRDLTRASPRTRTRAGLSYVPEDRLGTGLASGLTLEENLVLKNYNEPPHSRFGMLSPRAIDDTAGTLVEQFDVRGAREGMPVSLMSGGNLQKAILARELTRDHDVLVAASPTRGLDLAATAAVRGHILRETEGGQGVLLFSEDLSEITELSDLILVMYGGRIVGSFTRENLDVEELGLLMTGAKAHV
jgi:simple sugar transport system ATP-binding protein